LQDVAAFLVLLTHVRDDSFVEFGSLPTAQHTFSMALFFLLSRMGREAVLIFLF
jgi:hypothetical protein